MMKKLLRLYVRALLAVGFYVLSILAPSYGQSERTDPSQEQKQGEWRQSLNGKWSFTIDPRLVATQDASELTAADKWDSITVPGNWDVLPQYSMHKGTGWYRREFTVPADWKGKTVRLMFDAVYHEALVTLNGRELGKHVGGYTPFEFDVTDKVKYGTPNTVTVCADNTYRRGAWWPWGGISRNVTLIANNGVRIIWQHIRSEPDLQTGKARITIRYRLANSDTKDAQVTIASDVLGPQNLGVVASIPKTSVVIPAKSEMVKELALDLSKESVRLWHFDHPHLYALSSRLIADRGGEVQHTAADRFGIRKVVVLPDGLYLNGEKIRAPGFNRVSDSNGDGSTEPDALVKGDVDLMKRAGAVFSRLMHTPQAPNLLDYMDEKGMMIFAEIPVWGWDDKQVKQDNPLTKQWLREMIERDFNHPCIIGWSPGNEINGHYKYVESMHDYIRSELDPTRLVAYISNTAGEKGYDAKNDPVTVSDIAMINKYGGPKSFEGVAATLRSRWADKPVFFSEFGASQIGASLQARVPGAEGIWANISKEPFVIGGSLWTFNDYRSHFKGTPASGNREWGVVDAERRPKAAYWQIRSLYAPVKSISVAEGIVSIAPRSSSDVPSYILRGYKVAWKLLDSSGKETGTGEITLPDIAPDAPVWTSSIPGARDAARVKVSLVTPTGYEVADNEMHEPAKSVGK